MKVKTFTRFLQLLTAVLTVLGWSVFLAPVAVQAQADLQVVSVTHTTSPLEPGTTETFSVVVRNNGPNGAQDPSIKFLLFDLDFTMASYSGDGDWTTYSSGGTFTRKGNMPNGTEETITFSVFIPSDASFQSTGILSDAVYASIVSNTVDNDYGNNQLSSSLTVRANARLSIDKKLLTPGVAPGGYALYEIKVCNTGASDIGGIGVTDVPGANLVAGTLQLSPNASNLYIPAGDCRSVFATVQVDPAAPVGASFSNTVSLNTASATGGPGTNSAPELVVGDPSTDGTGTVVSALPNTDLEVVSITHITGPVVPGTTETFEIVVRNNGSADAYGAMVTMLITDLNWSIDNGNIPAGWSIISEGTWIRTTAMPSGETVTFSVDVAVPADAGFSSADPFGPLWVTTASANPDPNIANNYNSINLTSQAQATLTLSKTLLTPNVAPGGTALYEIQVCNNGPSDIRGIAVNDVPGANLVAGTLVLSNNASNLYIPVGQCVNVLASVQVDPAAPIGASFANQVSLSAAGASGGAGTNQAPVVNLPAAVNNTSGTVVNPLQNADLEVVSVTLLGGGPFVPGTNRSFEIVLRNNGPTVANGAVLTTTLFSFGEYVSSLGVSGWTQGSSGGTFTRVTPWPSGETVTFTIQYHLEKDAHYALNSYYNLGYLYAGVASANPDPSPGNNFNFNNFTSQAQATLTLEKTLLTPQVAPGGTALYEITVCNTGSSDIAGIAITDVPGANLVAGSLVLSGDADDLYIPAGQCVDVMASVRVSESAPVGATFSNSASISLATVDGGSTSLVPVVNVPGTVTNAVGVVGQALPAADVAVLAVRHPNTPLVPGTVERFEVDVRNNGGAPAYGVILNNLLINLSGTVVNGPTGAWVSQSNGNVLVRTAPMPPNTTETVFFEVLINSDVHYQAAGYTHWATVSASNPDPNTANNTLTNNLQSRLEANLTIDKKLLTPNVAPGGTALYEIEVCNNGPSDVAGVSIADVPGANLGSIVLGPNADNLYIADGECVVVTATGVVSASAPVGATFGNTASVNAGINQGFTTQAPVVNAPSDSDNSGVVANFLPDADLQVVNITAPAEIVPGNAYTFTYEVRNNGPAPAEGAALSLGFYNMDYFLQSSPLNGAWSFTGNNNLVRVNPMPAGTTETISFTVHVLPNSNYVRTNPATVIALSAHIAGSNPDPNSTNNRFAIQSVPTRNIASLSLEKTLLTPTVAPGGTALYELTICNDGPSDIRGIALNDVPGANLDAGTLVLSADAGDLYIPAGQCVDVMASVRVSASAVPGSSFVNAASLSAAGADSGPNGLTPTVTLPGTVTNNIGVVGDYLPPADIDVVTVPVVPLTSPIVAGQVYSFELRVRNNGPAPAEGVTVNNTFGWLPGSWQLVQQPSQSPWSANGHGIGATRTGAMPANTTELVGVFQVLIPSNAVTQGFLSGVFIQEVSATADNPDPNPGNNLAFVQRSVQNHADLAVEKVLLTPNVGQGGTALYSIEVTNNGPSDASNVFIDDVATGNVGTPIFGEANNFYVAAGQSRVVLVSLPVNDGAPVGSVVENCATVIVPENTFDPNDSNNGPSCVSFNVSPVLPDADVAITDVYLVGNDPLVPGTIRTFEFKAINNGPADAIGAVATSLLQEINYTVDNSSIPSGWNVVSTGGTWVRNTPWVAGQEQTFSVTLKIPSDAHYESGFFPIDDFIASIGAANPDPNTLNNIQFAFYESQAESFLSINKQTITPAVAPEGTALFEIVVCNEGPSDIRGIAIDDVVGANLDPASLVLSVDADNLYIAAGQCVDILASARVLNSAVPGTDFDNEACLNIDNADEGLTTLAAQVTFEVACNDAEGTVIDALPATDLELVSITHTTGPVVPGTTETFEIRVRNNGGAPAYGATVNLQFNDINWSIDNDGSAPGWSFVGNGTWIRTTAMPAGEDVTFFVDVAIPANASYVSGDPLGPVWAFAAASNPDPNTGNNGRALSFATQVQATLGIEKVLLTPEVSPGGTALFEIAVCNEGPSDIDGVSITDILGTNLSAGSLVLSPDADNLYIPAGQCVDVLVSATVSPSAAVGQSFCNTAEINLDDIDGGNGSTLAPDVDTDPSSDEACGTVEEYLPVADVDISVSSLGPNPVAAGDQLTFTLTVTNNGPAPAEHVIVHANMFSVQDYSFWLQGIPANWTFSSNGMTFSRSGSMPAGASETITVGVLIGQCEEPKTPLLVASVSAANPDPDFFNNDFESFEIIDDTPPVIVCPPSLTVGTDVDKCTAVVPYSIPQLFDACFGETVDLTEGPASGGVFQLGTTTVVYTATDPSNNETTCSFTVTVEDMQLPTASCKDTTIYLNIDGEAVVNAAGLNGVSTDNCGPVTFSACPDEGFAGDFAPANWTVDIDGNGSVDVSQAPVSVQLTSNNAGGGASETNLCIEVPVDGTISFQWNYQSFDVNGPYYDPFGYKVNGVFTKLTFDTGPGSSSGPLVQSGQSAVALQAGQDFCFTQAATDGILGAGVTISSMFVFADNLCTYTCANVGDNNAILTVIDAAGNASSCVATITVLDTIKPTFACPADLTVDACNDLVPNVIGDIVADDNCGVSTITQNPVPGLDFGQTNGDSVNITVTVTDVNGNASSCIVTVTINDDDAPDFLNCPTSMIMIGNDPDQCSGKVNWQPPVAVDDCVPLPISAPGSNPQPGTVVQTTGPAPGTAVAITCPPTPITITYIATDGAGNTASCTFQIMVVDTEEPEFDADIVMPNDTTVNCHQIPNNCVYHGPLICTPLTNNDVNDNCTDNEDLEIVFTEESTQCDDPSDCCYYDYDLTRTWTVTDCAGNQLIHVQEIEVQDTTKPVALCKNITVVLDKSGFAQITPQDINNGSFDNCALPQYLTYEISKSEFRCIDLGQNIVVLTVTDPCGNSSTCQAIVTVVEGIGMCDPAYSVKTNCLDNATTLENGQFEDIITVKALAMQTWRLTANNGGFFTATSAAPPAAGTVMPVGTLFTMGTADGIDNDGDGQVDEADEMIFYTLRGRFTECVGYSIQFSNSTNFGNAVSPANASISNKACYPHPYFINLDGPFCLNTPPFEILVGEYNNAAGTAINFMVNGVPTNIFNAGALGEGFHTVMATFDAGTATQNLVINGVQVGGSMADAIADPGCKQKITKVVQVAGTPTTVACNDLIQVSLDASCVSEVKPDMVLEGTYYCFDDYTVTLTYPAGTTQFTPPNRVNATHINKVVTYTLSHIISGNMCWGTVKVEDKLAPSLTCPPSLTVACSESTEIPHTGNVGIQDCSNTTTQVDNVVTDNGDCSAPRQVIVRTFIVTDAWGNQAACSQTITVEPFDLNDVIFPSDVTLNCENVYGNPNATLPSATGNPSINGASVTGSVLCDAKVNYTDTYYEGCEGTFTILRAWSILSDCLPVGNGNPVNHVQRIEVEDNGGPVFSCPANITVSVDPFTCCATAALPDIIVSEGCSNILDLEAKVTGVDPNSGNITTFTVPGTLADFPGNNHWDPDTLAVFPFTQCLPNGNTYTVTYTAADQCGNTSSCNFALTVADLVPPAVSCDEFTQVSLGIDGRVIVNAQTFDDGSYDNCCLDSLLVRRMFDGPCDQDTLEDVFAPTVEFCCADLGDTVMVVFRAVDCEGNYNDCMVEVFVDDKLKPACTAPANVTVSCENFDPSLWAYGAATAVDNCCLDTITTTVILTNFDTTCNRGTITRRFTAIDCAGQTSTCTQRIVVNYEQDFYVRFPNDKILYACDSSFFDQPTFFGEDCELLAVSYHDELFTVVPDACYKIERTWTIINWCTYTPNGPCTYVPNPNPNVNVNSSQNLPGPIVSAPGTTGPWAPTVVRINPTDPQPTNFSTFWAANTNCYQYKQIIKVIDTQDPVVTNCPTSPVEVCDFTPNDNLFWNEMYWWDNTIGSHDLCEAPTDLTITATDSCGGENVNIRYLLFLDLDQDGTMETVISSTNLPGFNNVKYNNANTPNYTGGEDREFDGRPVAGNQKYGFTLQTTVNVAAQTKTAAVRWNTFQSPNTFVVPQLPYGTHKIKWIVEDGCGNETICEYVFEVKDCKAPTVVCLNGLSANIMPTDMISLWAADFLQYTEDNCTPADQIAIGIRRKGAGTGFPTNPDGTPQTSVTFTCADLGTQFVELWGMDAAGNADFCETYVIVQDNAGNCSNSNVTVAGDLQTEMNDGLLGAQIELEGSHPALPPVSMFEESENDGSFMFANALPLASNYTLTPMKDDDHLNGVTTYDLVLINKHILGLEAFDSPYKIIAADANNSKSITTFDIAEFRKLILGIYTELPNNTSWRFVDQAYTFPNPDNPFTPAFPETKSVADAQANQIGEDFVAVKIGDVNGNAIANTLMSTDDRTSSNLLFDVEDRSVTAGEMVTVQFKAAERVTGYQFTLGLNGLEVVNIVPGEGMSTENFAVFADAVTTSFDANVDATFTVTFRAKQAGKLHNMLGVSSRITKAEAYSLGGERLGVALRFNGKDIRGVGFEVYQNQPNPWVSRTVIGFHLPEADDVTLTVFDETGRMLYRQTGDFAKGYNAFTLDKALLNTTGLLYYQVSTSTESASMKMIQTK